ncbi:B-cell receptor CD22-like [Alosa sapidissima]|uniref:B-cell receptor CD22-like n=1 Tax=Alosa sapidissima TaxID=34773 RepID=UPI001C095562|nr:B-cell receptor CD22-like [Alosa sapidissima]
MGLLLMVMSCVTSYSVMVLITTQGVCGQQWSVSYQPESICAFVGDSVDMSCSYTYPSGLSIKQAYWTNKYYGDYPDLRYDVNYKSRIHVNCSRAGRCQLRVNSLTTSDIGPFICRITTDNERGKWTGTPGVQLYVRDAPQTPFMSISPSGDIVEGTNVTQTCSSRSDLPVQKCSWYKTGSHVALQQQSSYTYTMCNIKPIHSGQYYCHIRYACGYKNSTLINLKVFYPPRNTKVVIDNPGQIAEGGRVTLTCSSDANPPPHTYSWYKGRAQLSYRQKMLTFSNVHSEDSGNYSCQATNTYGSNASPNTEIHVLYGPRTPVVVIDPPGNITEGSRVTLTCSSDANPPVESYTWFKVNESTPVGSGQQYSITDIRPEDGGQYYCVARNRLGSHVSTAVSITARNKYGAENSTTVSITVTSWQSPLSTAVITVSVCGAVGLLCLVFLMSKKCKKNATQTREDRNTRDYVNVAQSGPSDGTQPDAVYQSLNPNTTQPDAVYQSLHLNTIQPDAVYQSLNPNTMQPDAIYQSLNPNTTQPNSNTT